jgi:hemerythrin
MEIDLSHRIEWSDDLLVKIDAIDRDHKHLFALANKIFANTGKDMALVSSAIDILFSYTKEHFSREETAMRDFNYPAIQDHIFDHKELVAQLNDFNDQFIKSGPKAIDESFATFLEHWLRDHILKFDQSFADFLRQFGSHSFVL